MTENTAIRLAHGLLTYEIDMRLSEIITIYLAIGAPFGVYVFVQAEKPHRQFLVWLKTFGAILFYPFFVLNPIRHFFFSGPEFQALSDEFAGEAAELDKLQRDLTKKLFAEKTANLELFDFREVLERYIGLSMALRDSLSDAAEFTGEAEIFRLSGRADAEIPLAGRILRRRNFLQLQTHQIRARRDFLRFFDRCREKSVLDLAREISDILEDAEAVRFFRETLETEKNLVQNNSQANVKQVESVRKNNVPKEDETKWKPKTSPIPLNQPIFNQSKRAQALTTQIQD